MRWVVRVSLRSCGAAPICAVASASIKACSMVCSSRRISSPESALRSASGRPDQTIAMLLGPYRLPGYSIYSRRIWGWRGVV